MPTGYLWSRENGHQKLETVEVKQGKIYFYRDMAKRPFRKIKKIIKLIIKKARR